MVRIVVFIVFYSLFIPFLSFAQDFAQFRRPEENIRLMVGPGSLEFMDGRIADGKLSYYGGLRPHLLVQTTNEEMRYSAHQIRSFRLLNHEYVTVGNFTIALGGVIKHRANIDRDFAQVVEAGPLELLIHQGYVIYELDKDQQFIDRRLNPNIRPRYQAFQKGSYLLRKAGEFAPVAVFDMAGSSDKELRNTLSYYLASRPDLVRMLKDKSFSHENLPAYIHAYNTGQPL